MPYAARSVNRATTWVYEEHTPMASYLATVQIGRYDEANGNVVTVWPEDGADRVGLRIQGTDEIAQELTDLGVLRGAAHRFEGEGT